MKLETKFGNRIDSDSGYDNLKLAQDLVTIAEKHYTKQLLIPRVVGRSEQLVCSCGSIKVQTTGGFQCPNNRCSSAN
jgi:hypothetical protein